MTLISSKPKSVVDSLTVNLRSIVDSVDEPLLLTFVDVIVNVGGVVSAVVLFHVNVVTEVFVLPAASANLPAITSTLHSPSPEV